MDSLTSKTLRMKKLFIKKGFHSIVFAVKVLINLSENQQLTFSRSMYIALDREEEEPVRVYAPGARRSQSCLPG